jgi:hypothetical protein
MVGMRYNCFLADALKEQAMQCRMGHMLLLVRFQDPMNMCILQHVVEGISTLHMVDVRHERTILAILYVSALKVFIHLHWC